MVHQFYFGTVSNGDGTTKQVTLKQGSIHWIDTEGNRWRDDGRLAPNAPKWPRLLMHSITTATGASRHYVQKMTHEGRVRKFTRNAGKGRYRNLRQSKLYWIDEAGTKFRKGDGWEVSDSPQQRLTIESVRLK